MAERRHSGRRGLPPLPLHSGRRGHLALLWLACSPQLCGGLAQDAAPSALGAPAPPATVRTAREILNCKGKEGWEDFLTLVLENTEKGWPIEAPVSQFALDLFHRDTDLYEVHKHRHMSSLTCPAWEQLVSEMCEGVKGGCGHGSTAEDLQYDAPDPKQSCFYGDINARWVLARVMQKTINNNYGQVLNISHFFETSQKARNIFNLHTVFSDWVEESSWPILPLDILASSGRCGSIFGRRRAGCGSERPQKRGAIPWIVLPDSDVVDPSTVPKIRGFATAHAGWHRVVLRQTRPEDFEGKRLLTGRPSSEGREIRVWELGIHKILSAEVLTALHRAALDMGILMRTRNLLNEQYPAYMDRCSLYVNMSCVTYNDQLSEVVTNAIVRSSSWFSAEGASMDWQYYDVWSWATLTSFARSLTWVVEAFSFSADLLVVTQPLVLLAALKLSPALRSLPTLVYSSSHLDYMVERHTHKLWKSFLVTQLAQSRNVLVSMFSWNAFMMESALRLQTIPVIGGVSLYMGAGPKTIPTKGLYVLSRDTPDDCLVQCLLRRLRTELSPNSFQGDIVFARDFKSSWREIAKFHAVALFPYASFTMTLEELLNLAVPVFVPRHYSKHIYDTPFLPRTPASLRAVFSRLAMFETFTRPFIVHFDSLSDLLRRLSPARDAHMKLWKQTMVAYSADQALKRLALWKAVLGRRLGARPGTAPVKSPSSRARASSA